MARTKNSITLDRIISTNLDVLESQEDELMSMLNFVRKAKKLFKESATSGASTGKKRGPKPGRPRKKKSAGRPRKTVVRKSTGAKRGPKKKSKIRKGSHLDRVYSTLHSLNGKASSGEVIQAMFENQKASKDLGRYRQLIYPVLTRAYKSGILVKKNGKVQVPA